MDFVKKHVTQFYNIHKFLILENLLTGITEIATQF